MRETFGTFFLKIPILVRGQLIGSIMAGRTQAEITPRERRRLAMFAEQAARLLAAMTAMPAETGALAHKLKGSARGIGAYAVADAAADLEAAIRTGRGRSDAFAALKEAVTAASAAIEAILKP